MVKMPSASEIDAKYKEAIGRVPASYKAGVQKTTGWQAAAIAGQDLYVAKMQDSSILARRERALANTSDEAWKAKAADLGASRIGPGMSANTDKRAKNYEPYRNALESVSLAQRTADPITNVDNRVKPIVAALVAKKKEVLG